MCRRGRRDDDKELAFFPLFLLDSCEKEEEEEDSIVVVRVSLREINAVLQQPRGGEHSSFYSSSPSQSPGAIWKELGDSRGKNGSI